MTDYELIMCIVNTGFSETVMEAAKDKGARGGTIIHARGTANKNAEAFFNVTIQPDKEIVMILVPHNIRDDVMHALYQTAGLKTAGQGIAFALPVTHTVGLAPTTQTEQPNPDEQKKEEEPKPDKSDGQKKEDVKQEQPNEQKPDEQKTDDEKTDDQKAKDKKAAE